MYPRSLLGKIKGEAQERTQDNTHDTTLPPSVASILHLHPSLVFTPVQALRCRIIQTLPPAGRRAFSCPNQDKSLCLFASPSGKGSTHTNLLVGVTPWGKTPTFGAPGRGPACFSPISHSFPDGHSHFADSTLHGDLVWELLGILNIITKSRLSSLNLVTVQKMRNLSLTPLKPSCHPQHDIRDALLKYAIALLNK